MQRRNSWVNWKLVVGLGFILLILIGLFYIISLYTYLETTKVTDKEQTIDYVFAHTELSTIEEINEFQEQDVYHIVHGQTAQGDWTYVFLPLSKMDDPDELHVFSEDEFISQGEIESSWQNECNGCVKKNTQLAMIEEHPLLEIAYKDAANHYVLTYISLLDGSVYEQIQL